MLIKGFLLGIALSAPIGVIGLWCIQRSINHGFRYGFATGLGAVVADMLFAVLAILGFSQLIEPWLKDNPWPSLIGAAFIMFMGFQILRNANPDKTKQSKQNPSLIKSFMGSFLLIMTHPAAILVFLAIFTGLGIGIDQQTSWLTSAQLLLGILLGGVSWWVFLLALSSLLGKRMTPNLMQTFNWISGIIVIILGALLAISNL